jgi:hypothetical protein
MVEERMIERDSKLMASMLLVLIVLKFKKDVLGRPDHRHVSAE